MPDDWIVMTFVGDYPAEAQFAWNKNYATKHEAIIAAQKQHKRMNNNSYYTVVGRSRTIDRLVHWIIYKDKIIADVLEATKLANKLAGEEHVKQ